MIKNCIAIIILVFSFSVFSSDFGLENLTKKQFKGLVEEMGANTKHTTVSGASLLGDGKKYEFGLVLGNTQADTLKSLLSSYSTDGTTAMNALPYYGLLGMVTLPYDLTGEVVYLPEIGMSGVRSTFASGALKWTLPNKWDLPFDSAIRAFGGFSRTEWGQTVSSTPVDVEAKGKSYGLEGVISRKFGFVDPYFNLGYMFTNGEINTTGSATIFDSSFTSSNTVDESASAMTYAFGANLTALFMRFGAEIGEAFDNRFIRFKVSATF